MGELLKAVKPKETSSNVLTLRVSDTLLKRLDEQAERFQNTRSGLAKSLLEVGLDELEKTNPTA